MSPETAVVEAFASLVTLEQPMDESGTDLVRPGAHIPSEQDLGLALQQPVADILARRGEPGGNVAQRCRDTRFAVPGDAQPVTHQCVEGQPCRVIESLGGEELGIRTMREVEIVGAAAGEERRVERLFDLPRRSTSTSPESPATLPPMTWCIES